MINEQDIPFVQCLVTCDNMSQGRGNHCYLPLPKARLLEARGSVKISGALPLTKSKERKDTDYLYRQVFNKRTLTRVAWVQNYSKNGGAEISNYEVIKIGEKLGYDIVGNVLDSDYFSYSLLDSADIIIVNNLHAGRKDEFVDYLMQTERPFIKYDHDLQETDLRLFKRSRLNVFISPMHRQHYVKLAGDVISSKSVCLPLAFDVDKYSSAPNGRSSNSVFIPSYGKCRDAATAFIKSNPDKLCYIASSVLPYGVNVKGVGEISYDKIHEHYPHYDTVFHCPTNGGAGERVLFEAVLSGCKVIHNDKCGHASWDFDWKDDRVLRPILKRATYEFWREVEKCLPQ